MDATKEDIEFTFTPRKRTPEEAFEDEDASTMLKLTKTISRGPTEDAKAETPMEEFLFTQGAWTELVENLDIIGEVLRRIIIANEEREILDTQDKDHFFYKIALLNTVVGRRTEEFETQDVFQVLMKLLLQLQQLRDEGQRAMVDLRKATVEEATRAAGSAMEARLEETFGGTS